MGGRFCLGGTFDTLHSGHKALLRRALEAGEEVLVGITSDEMARSSRHAPVAPFGERKARIAAFLRGLVEREFPGRRFTITGISDRHGPAATRDDLDGIVVSPETRPVAEEINRVRARAGLRPLDIHEIPFVLAEDGLPISASRIRSGEVDADGRLIASKGLTEMSAGEAEAFVVSYLRSRGRLTTRDFEEEASRRGKVCPDGTARFLMKMKLRGIINGEVSIRRKGWVWWV